jgi:hypothetical protein
VVDFAITLKGKRCMKVEHERERGVSVNGSAFYFRKASQDHDFVAHVRKPNLKQRASRAKGAKKPRVLK